MYLGLHDFFWKSGPSRELALETQPTGSLSSVLQLQSTLSIFLPYVLKIYIKKCRMIPDSGVKGGERKFQNSESDFQLLLGAFSTPLGPIDATRSQKPLLTSNQNL